MGVIINSLLINKLNNIASYLSFFFVSVSSTSGVALSEDIITGARWMGAGRGRDYAYVRRA